MRRTIAWLFTIVLAATTGAVLSGTVAVLTAPFPEQASADASEAMAWSFYDAVNTVLRTGETGPLDALLAPEMIEHNPAPGLPSTRDGLTRHLLGLHATAPGTQIVPENVFASDDTVTARVRIEGSAQRVFLGVPVGVEGLAWGTLDQFRVVAHRIVEHWSSVDPDAVLEPLRQMPLREWFAPEQLVSLQRITCPAGAQLENHVADESRVIYLESGELTVTLHPRSDRAMSFMAGSGAGPAGRPQEIAPGASVTLAPGDVLAVPMLARYRLHNNGAGPAAALVVVATVPENRGSNGHLSSVPPGPVGGAEGRGDAVEFHLLAGSSQTALPVEQAAVAIGRATLAPGRMLVLPGAAGPLLLVAESGPLAIDIDAGTVWVNRVQNGYSIIERDEALRVGDGTLVDPETPIALRNLGSEPAVILIVTILPESTAE